jgi:hypothetical protein
VRALLLVCLLAATASAEKLRYFDTPEDALRAILAEKPKLVAFGEYHETKGAPKVASAIARFRDLLLPVVSDGASDLLMETWVTEGKCGKQEETVVAQVEESTKRPETTESEVVQVMKKAKAAGVQPHILKVSCDEYQSLTGTDGAIDYVRLLSIVTTHLQGKIDEILAKKPKVVLVYGGALHNDLHPRKELAQFSFAAAVKKQLKGAYAEVDLYVPEYIGTDKKITAEPWYKQVKSDKTTLVTRSAGSHIIVFPSTPIDAAAFARLKTLVGKWEAKTDKDATIGVSYRLVSNGSVLVQSFVTPSKKETLTLFHADRDRLLATHYCAQGNQPRLRLDPASTDDRLLFVFADATNLTPSASHLVRLEVRLDGPDQYTEIETYDESGKPDVTTLKFRRVR